MAINSYNIISSKSIIPKIERDWGIENLSEASIIEYLGEVLEQMGIAYLYDEYTGILPIENFFCITPNQLVSIVSINYFTGRITNPDNEDIFDIITYEKFKDSQFQDFGFCFKDINKYAVQLLPKNYTICSYRNSFNFNTSLKDANNCGNKVIYDVKENKIFFNREMGTAIVTFLKQKLDDEGYPYILDDIFLKNCISNYIGYKNALRKSYNSIGSYTQSLPFLKNNYEVSLRIAINNLVIPEVISKFIGYTRNR